MVVQKMIEDAIREHITKTAMTPKTLVMSDVLISALRREIFGIDYVLSCLENKVDLDINEYRDMKVVTLWHQKDPMTLLVG
jgi:hypothetical protein